MSSSDIFDWHRDPDVIIRPVLGLAIYINQKGEVCLRQQADWCDNDDSYVVFPATEAMKVADRIKTVAAGLPEVDG